MYNQKFKIQNLPSKFAVVAAGLACLSLAGCSTPLGLTSGGESLGQYGSYPGGAPNAPGGGGMQRRSAESNPNILSGLRVSPTGKWGLKVDPGSYSLSGKQLAIAQPQALSESAPPSLEVKGEEVSLGLEPPRSYDHGARLKGVSTGVTTVPGALDPASVVVWSGPEASRRVYRQNIDYLVDPEWGTLSRKPGGSIADGKPVFVDYRVRQLRLDTVEVRPNGAAELKKGEPSRLTPTAPQADADSLAIANVFLDYGVAKITSEAIFPIGTALPAPTAQERQAMAAAVTHTREKLQSNGHISVVFWGDNITQGESASAPGKRFPDLVGQAIQAQYKGSQVSVINAGTAGSNIDTRLPSLEKEVLSHHPDLVVIGFLNDMALPLPTLRRDYTLALEQIKKAGSEIIVVTPNFTLPQWMGMRSLRGKDPRPAVEALRQVAQKENVGLADVSRHWEHLAVEGIPYTTLLADGVSEPDDRGQAIYARTIEEFF